MHMDIDLYTSEAIYLIISCYNWLHERWVSIPYIIRLTGHILILVQLSRSIDRGIAFYDRGIAVLNNSIIMVP